MHLGVFDFGKIGLPVQAGHKLPLNCSGKACSQHLREDLTYSNHTDYFQAPLHPIKARGKSAWNIYVCMYVPHANLIMIYHLGTNSIKTA
jgi:hypothetical protein